MNRTNIDIIKFVSPEIIFGMNAISQVGESALRLGAKKIFVVTDCGVKSHSWVKKVLLYLDQAGLEYQVWYDLTSNPKDTEVARGAEEYLASKCDAIVAVGGGSPIDTAKSIATIATNGGKIQDYEGINKITRRSRP